MKDMHKIFALLKKNYKRWIIESCLHAGVIKNRGWLWNHLIFTKLPEKMHKKKTADAQTVCPCLAGCRQFPSVGLQIQFRYSLEQNINMYKYILHPRMRSSLVRMRSSLVVRASDCQFTSCNGPGFDPSIRRHSGIWGAANEAVLNIVRTKRKNPPKNIFKKSIYINIYICSSLAPPGILFRNWLSMAWFSIFGHSHDTWRC